MSNVMRGLLDPSALIAPLIAFLLAAPLAFAWSTRRWNRLAGVVTRSVYELVHAGVAAHDYFNADVMLSSPANVKEIAAWLKRGLIAERAIALRPNRVAFIDKAEGPVGAIGLKDLTAFLTGLPTIVVRLRNEIPEPTFSLAGAPAVGARGLNIIHTGEHIVIVSDVATSGRTIIEAAERLRAAGAVVDRALVLCDREEGGRQMLIDHGISLEAYTTSSVWATVGAHALAAKSKASKTA